ncbi:glycine zipper 2TM domain-containing protein [Sphingomonas abaci]|uniref:17 kDa surface antigen n=1 Tax=Sphingomonas abaci TaxID=237611 RepID=A0A7W7AII4_9SPHN|nr:glycine zipper 2TM domain-containing protein [Sphingomonas abaci]MBB4617691.1 outer membrane lipoprotein SlyB [Sphingomonas abaci]
MRKLMLVLGCAAMVTPTLIATTENADAQRRYKYREWRDDRGRVRCRKPDGTTGLVVGGLAGGALGNIISNGRSSLLGTLIGAGGGALLGRSVDRGQVVCR